MAVDIQRMACGMNGSDQWVPICVERVLFKLPYRLQHMISLSLMKFFLCLEALKFDGYACTYKSYNFGWALIWVAAITGLCWNCESLIHSPTVHFLCLVPESKMPPSPQHDENFWSCSQFRDQSSFLKPIKLSSDMIYRSPPKPLNFPLKMHQSSYHYRCLRHLVSLMYYVHGLDF